MKFTANPKEQTMTATQKLTRIAALVAPAAALAASAGYFGSDANLKQAIETADGLNGLRRL